MLNFIEYAVSYQEYLGYTAALLEALSFLPQLVKVWRFCSVKDISLAMYIIYTTSVILWLAYGIIIKSAPLITAEILTLVLVSAILIMEYIWR